MKKPSKEEQLAILKKFQSDLDIINDELSDLLDTEIANLTEEERKVFLDEVARNNRK